MGNPGVIDCRTWHLASNCSAWFLAFMGATWHTSIAQVSRPTHVYESASNSEQLTVTCTSSAIVELYIDDVPLLDCEWCFIETGVPRNFPMAEFTPGQHTLTIRHVYGYSPTYCFEITLPSNGRFVSTGSQSTTFCLDFGEAAQFEIELEPRLIRWRLPVSGQFDDSTNWSPATVPGLQDAVVFDQPGTYTVTMNGSHSVRALELKHGEVEIVNGDLSVSESAEISGSLVVAGGTLHAAQQLTIPASGTLRLAAGDSRVEAPGAFEVLGLLTGCGTVDGFVQLRGRVRASLLDASNFTLRFEGPLVCAPDDPNVSMEVEVGPDGFSIIESAYQMNLHGKLVIDSLPGFVPVIGSRFNIVSGEASPQATPLTGRFDEVQGTYFDADAWFAVNHEFARPRASFLQDPSPQERQRSVELLTCETPRKWNRNLWQPWSLSGSQSPRGLMFLTHGTQSSIPEFWNPGQGGFGEMAASASAFAANAGLSGAWDVVTLDWSPFSTGGFLRPAFDPFESAYVGSELAWSLSRWLEEANINISRAHLLSHSSGTWLINSLSRELIRRGQVSINSCSLTAFDAFGLPGTCVGVPGLPCLNLGPFGDAVTLGTAEQYVDMKDVPAGLPTTNMVLPQVYNVGVTDLFDLPSGGPVIRHAWPYIWYTKTIPSSIAELAALRCDTSPNGNWGFVRSPMCQDLNGFVLDDSCDDPIARLSLLGSLIELPNGLAVDRPEHWWQFILDPSSATVSNTGTVTFSGGGVWLTTGSPASNAGMIAFADGGVGLTTGSPVWARSVIDIPGMSDFIRLTINFSDEPGLDGPGTLVLRLDGEQIVAFSRDSVPGLSFTTDWLRLPRRFSAGNATLEMRLDPDDVGQRSSVRINEIEFGAVPCRGDLNADGLVDDADFQVFIVAYNILDCADPAMTFGCPSDLTADALVEDSDFQVFIVAYNELICP